MATYNVLAYDSTNNLPTLPNSSDTVNVAGEATFAKSVVIDENLTVKGTTTTLNTEIQTADRSVVLNSDYSAGAVEDAYIMAVTDPNPASTPWTGANYNIFIENSSSIKFQGSTAPSSTAQWPVANDLVLIKNHPNVNCNGIFEVENASTAGSSAYIVVRNGSSTGTPQSDVVGFCNTTMEDFGSSSSFLPSDFEIVPIKVTGIKTDSANGAIQSVSGDKGGAMTVTTLAGGGTAADDITAGDAAVEITTSSGNVALDSPSGAAVKLQVNGADNLVCDGDEIQIKAGKNLLIEDTALLATQLTFAGSSSVTNYDVLYINSSGQLARADADGGSIHYNVVGTAIEDGPSGGAAVKAACTTSGQAVGVKFTGGDPVSGDRGKPVYLSTTAGQVSLTAPSSSGDHKVQVGFVYSSSSLATNVFPIIFQPQYITQVS